MEDAVKKHEEIMVLSHEPWPGFRLAFAVVFALACVYLAVVLFFSFEKLDATGHGPAATQVSSHE